MFSLLVCCVHDVPFGIVKINYFSQELVNKITFFVVVVDVKISDFAAALQQRENACRITPSVFDWSSFLVPHNFARDGR
jgi:hypothetical protein